MQLGATLTQTVRQITVALAAAFLFILLVPAGVVEAQEVWPTFPATQSGDRPSGFTTQMFEAVLCPQVGDRSSCTHQGRETGTDVTIYSTCTYDFLEEDLGRGFNKCVVTFSDNRYEASFERGQLNGGNIHVEVTVNGQEMPNQQESLLSIQVAEDDEGNQQVVGTAAATEDNCSLIGGDLGLCLRDIVGKLGASIMFLLVTVLAIFLGMVGSLFNWIMLVTVFQYSNYFGNTEGMLVAWSVLRDLGNILLLFGFIFIGLQTILNIGHFSVGKALPRLLIFAILINFSLFVSSAIVDTANLMSSVFYMEVGSVDCGNADSAESAGAGGTPQECTGQGISGKVLEAAGMANFFDGVESLDNIWDSGNGFNAFLTYFGLAIFLLVLMIVMLAACIMFIIRAITLMFLLVISPIGFAMTAIPQFEEYSSMWWKSLLKQAFFAPIFLIMLFVGLKILEGADNTFNSSDSSLAAAFAAGGVSTGGIFILFMLVIGFMIGALMVANNFGAVGASFATRKASGAVLGGMGFVGRHTAGRAMFRGAEELRKTKFARTGMGRLVVGGLDAGGKASFDGRSAASKALGGAHLDMGKSQHGGYDHVVHEKTEKSVKYAKSLGKTKEEKERIDELGDEKVAESKEYSDNTKAMNAAHAAAKAPILDQINAARQVAEAARASGNKSSIATAEATLSNLNADYGRLAEAQGQEQAAEKSRHEARMAQIAAEEKRTKDASKREYANNLGSFGNRKVAGFGYRHSAFKDADEHAKHQIHDELDKNENQKLIDALTGVQSKLDKPPPPAAGAVAVKH